MPCLATLLVIVLGAKNRESDDREGHSQKRPRHWLMRLSEHLLCAQPHSGSTEGGTVADEPWAFPSGSYHLMQKHGSYTCQ